MIGKLKGVVDYIDKDYLIIDVNGVGYVVYCSSRTLNLISALGEVISLIIETHVREDHITLYGFISHSERDWFRTLITVKGVGSKVALAIQGILSAEKISIALSTKDKLAFSQVSGIGPRLAERIVTELKDKIVASFDDVNIGGAAKSSKSVLQEESIVPDAVSALTNLGYSKIEAYNAANKLISANPSLNVGELIRLSLKELSK
ncbi:MAG: Holliday junction branch migration protein RuvA [Alphaproteobacteria bacterium]